MSVSNEEAGNEKMILVSFGGRSVEKYPWQKFKTKFENVSKDKVNVDGEYVEMIHASKESLDYVIFQDRTDINCRNVAKILETALFYDLTSVLQECKDFLKRVTFTNVEDYILTLINIHESIETTKVDITQHSSLFGLMSLSAAQAKVLRLTFVEKKENFENLFNKIAESKSFHALKCTIDDNKVPVLTQSKVIILQQIFYLWCAMIDAKYPKHYCKLYQLFEKMITIDRKDASKVRMPLFTLIKEINEAATAATAATAAQMTNNGNDANNVLDRLVTRLGVLTDISKILFGFVVLPRLPGIKSNKDILQKCVCQLLCNDSLITKINDHGQIILLTFETAMQALFLNNLFIRKIAEKQRKMENDNSGTSLNNISLNEKAKGGFNKSDAGVQLFFIAKESKAKMESWNQLFAKSWDIQELFDCAYKGWIQLGNQEESQKMITLIRNFFV